MYVAVIVHTCIIVFSAQTFGRADVVMDARHMEFPNASFDLIIDKGANLRAQDLVVVSR